MHQPVVEEGEEVLVVAGEEAAGGVVAVDEGDPEVEPNPKRKL